VPEAAAQEHPVQDAASSVERAAADLPMTDEPSTFVVELEEGAANE
jgi:hypothetical protein